MDGLPVGMQVLAPHHRDALLFDVALAAERAMPWPKVRSGRHARAVDRLSDTRLTTIDRGALRAAILPVAAGVLPNFLTGALAVQIRADLDFSEAGLGLLSGAFFAGGASSSVVLGRFAERVGAVRALRLAATGSAVVLLAIAALGRTYGSLVTLMVVGGTVNAMAQPAANLFLVRSMPARRMGLAFAIKQSAIPAGALFGGLAVPTIALTVGWRWAFVAAAALAVAAARSVPDHQPEAHAPSAPDRTWPTIDAPRRITLAFAAGASLAAAIAGVLGTFLVSGAVAVGLSAGTAGLLAAGGSAHQHRHAAPRRRPSRSGRHWTPSRRRRHARSRHRRARAPRGRRADRLRHRRPDCIWVRLGLAGTVQPGHGPPSPTSPAAATGITQMGVYLGAVLGPMTFGLVAEGGYGGAWLMAGCWAVAAAAVIAAARLLLVHHRR